MSMTQAAALAAIKTLRDMINDRSDATGDAIGWEHEVLDRLDRASDAIEFPEKVRGEAENEQFDEDAAVAAKVAPALKAAIGVFFDSSSSN